MGDRDTGNGPMLGLRPWVRAGLWFIVAFVVAVCALMAATGAVGRALLLVFCAGGPLSLLFIDRLGRRRSATPDRAVSGAATEEKLTPPGR